MLTFRTYNHKTIFGAFTLTLLTYFLLTITFKINEEDNAIQHAILLTTIIISLSVFENFRIEIKKTLTSKPKIKTNEISACLSLILIYHLTTTLTNQIENKIEPALNTTLLTLLSAIIISPIVEEVLFREIIFKNHIEKSRFQIFYIVSFSIVFSLLHNSESFHLILLLSITIYSIRVISNSLVLCVITHSAWNSIFILTWIYGN